MTHFFQLPTTEAEVAPWPSGFALARRPARRGPDVAKSVVWLLATLAGLLTAIFGKSAAVGFEPVDGVYRFLFVAAVVHTASRARRWTLVHLAAVSAATAELMWIQLVAIVALVIAIHSYRSVRRSRAKGSLVAAISLPVLLAQGPASAGRLLGNTSHDRFGTSVAVTIVAVAPLLVTAWNRASGRRRREVKLSVLVLISAIVVTTVVSGISLAYTNRQVTEAFESAEASAQLAADGDLTGAAVDLRRSSASWEVAHRSLTRPWLLPGRLLPVIAQNIRAAQTATGEAVSISRAASRTADQLADTEFVTDGSVNVAAIDGLTPNVDALTSTLDRARWRLAGAENGWLIGPMAGHIRFANEQLSVLATRSAGGAGMLRAAIDLLEAGDDSVILLMVATPAEARGTGGFVGQWAELDLTDGRPTVSRQLRSSELNTLLEQASAELVAPVDYEARYGRFDVERHIQDVTLSPDFPSVASVASNLYEAATGRTVGAVVMLDPFVIAALLELTGEIETESGLALNSETAVQELLVGQYERFAGNEEAREDLLIELAPTVLTRLIDSPPTGAGLAASLLPSLGSDRLAIWLSTDDRSAVDLGVGAEFPRIGESSDDVFGVVHQNAGQNKIDTFLTREIDVETDVDLRDGSVVHRARLLLRNDAPAAGLSEAIIGSNDQRLPSGTNRMTVAFYSPHRVTGALVAGVPHPVETQQEFEMFVHSLVLGLSPGETKVVDIELTGIFEPDPIRSEYSLTIANQPLTRPDVVHWKINGETVVDGLTDRDIRVVVPTDSSTSVRERP